MRHGGGQLNANALGHVFPVSVTTRGSVNTPYYAPTLTAPGHIAAELLRTEGCDPGR